MRCPTLAWLSPLIRMLWICRCKLYSSPQNKQSSNRLNFGTSDGHFRFRDNRSLEKLSLPSFLFKCLSICAFEVYVERQLLCSLLQACRLLYKESFLSLLAPHMEQFFLRNTSVPLWRFLKCALIGLRKLLAIEIFLKMMIMYFVINLIFLIKWFFVKLCTSW